METLIGQRQTIPADISSVLEEEIKKAFEQVAPDETRVAFMLSLLSLKPIEEKLLRNYKISPSDKRLKFPPIAVLRSILLKKLKGINSSQQLIAYLFTNPEESRLLGFERFLPSVQTYSVMRRERINAEIEEQIDFVADRIRQFVEKNSRHFDIDFVSSCNIRI